MARESRRAVRQHEQRKERSHRAELTGFEASIEPLFREQDRESMLQSFDLWDLCERLTWS